MISIKNIHKKYGKNVILSGVDYDFPEGKFIAFIGGNGAGKSTLLSVMTRTLDQDDGQIFVDDTEIKQFKSHKLSQVISVLPQANNMNLRMTVEKLVAFGRFPYSQGNLTQEDKEKVEEAIDYMGLGYIRKKFVDELSGGQRQMAYIAMIIAQDTPYVFLDEPLNNLDMKHSSKIMKLLKRLVAERKKTVMVVIHDINFVAAYADFVVGLKDGEIVESGTLEEVLNTDSLRNIYDIDIQVSEVNNTKICLYY